MATNGKESYNIPSTVGESQGESKEKDTWNYFTEKYFSCKNQAHHVCIQYPVRYHGQSIT